ncbi:class I SAM-dependent methyltransferase [Actinomycetospora endophytica]|uniref:Class I SAM-dependent methyltransferase n=1 Tax=Actinomycetospora endophytica TaxID=2291215 RepID=A0ABS8PF80_9PSEU|nr:class I SAM-dependent methyltransferase [Actinomycetospora endophytica]MCD2196913.1 class I SAM-dependent methyltransferase [Actinomycetospora endophytica]
MTPAATAPGAPRPVTPVGILAAALDDVLDRAQRGALDADGLDRLREARDLAVGLDPYLERCTTPESTGLAALARRTVEHDWRTHSGGTGLEQEMLSGHVEGQLLRTLVHATRARSVLEIGMFTGYSALAMAEAVGDDGRVVACEVDADVAALARECFAGSPAGGRIDVRVGPAADTLRALAGESFDLVFVDADKAGYADYLTALLDGGLLGPRGLVVVDNTLMQGRAYGAGAPTANGAAIAAFNDAVAADPRVEQVLVPLRDGMTLIRRVEEDR